MSKKPTHKPLSTKPMTAGNAVRELYDLVKCGCPGNRQHLIQLKAALRSALMLDMGLHSGGVAPSKVECEQMAYGAPEGHPEEGRVPEALDKKFPEVVRVLNDFLN